MSPSLPFPKQGVLKDKPDTTIIASLPMSLWPVSQRVLDAGAHYDHTSEVPLVHRGAVEVPNRFIEVDGRRFQVLEATAHEYMPHMELRLRESKPGG